MWLVYIYACVCGLGQGLKEERWLEHFGVCVPEASALSNSWKQKISVKTSSDESFMHVVQTCHSDVKIHQLSEPITPGAELNNPQLQLRKNSQPSPFQPLLGNFSFPCGALQGGGWMGAWMPGGNPPRPGDAQTRLQAGASLAGRRRARSSRAGGDMAAGRAWGGGPGPGSPQAAGTAGRVPRRGRPLGARPAAEGAGSPGLRSASLGGRIPAPDFRGGCRGLSRPCAILLG